jgi:general secretion pathway protein L
MSEFVLLRVELTTLGASVATGVQALPSKSLQIKDWIECRVTPERVETLQAGFGSDSLPNKPLIALLASPDVAVRYVAVPKEGRERFRQAIAFKLEDNLISDVDQLRFFLPEYSSDGHEPVAIIDESTAAHLQTLKQTLPNLRAVVPLPCLLPVDTVWVENGLCTYRFGTDDAGSIENDAFGALLRIKQSVDGALPLQVYLHGNINTDAVRFPKHFIVEQLAQPLQFLAQRLSSNSKLVSLLPKPEQSSSSRWTQHAAPWRWPLRMAAALLTVYVLGFGLQTWQLQRKANAQSERISSIYRELFPGRAEAADPLAMIVSKLSSEQQTALAQAKGGALPLLRKIAPILYTEIKPTLISMLYQNGELELALRAPDLATIDGVRARLATLAGLQVTLGNNTIDPDGKMLTGRIRVKESS